MTPQGIAEYFGLSETTVYRTVIPEARKAHPELHKEFFYVIPALAGPRDGETSSREAKEKADLTELDQLLANCHAVIARAENILKKEVMVSE